jgi:hypothetical protein
VAYHKRSLSANEAENSDYGKYTMQLNILAKMLRERYGIDVADNMFAVETERRWLALS